MARRRTGASNGVSVRWKGQAQSSEIKDFDTLPCHPGDGKRRAAPGVGDGGGTGTDGADGRGSPPGRQGTGVRLAQPTACPRHCGSGRDFARVRIGFPSVPRRPAYRSGAPFRPARAVPLAGAPACGPVGGCRTVALSVPKTPFPTDGHRALHRERGAALVARAPPVPGAAPGGTAHLPAPAGIAS